MLASSHRFSCTFLYFVFRVIVATSETFSPVDLAKNVNFVHLVFAVAECSTEFLFQTVEYHNNK